MSLWMVFRCGTRILDFFERVFSPPSCYLRYFCWRKALFPQRPSKGEARSSAVANSMLSSFGTHDLSRPGFRLLSTTPHSDLPWGTFAASLYGVLVGFSVYKTSSWTCGLHSAETLRYLYAWRFLLALILLPPLFGGADRSRRKFQPLFDGRQSGCNHDHDHR